jgi:hypothetical protein
VRTGYPAVQVLRDLPEKVEKVLPFPLVMEGGKELMGGRLGVQKLLVGRTLMEETGPLRFLPPIMQYMWGL